MNCGNIISKAYFENNHDKELQKHQQKLNHILKQSSKNRQQIFQPLNETIDLNSSYLSQLDNKMTALNRDNQKMLNKLVQISKSTNQIQLETKKLDVIREQNYKHLIESKKFQTKSLNEDNTQLALRICNPNNVISSKKLEFQFQKSRKVLELRKKKKVILEPIQQNFTLDKKYDPVPKNLHKIIISGPPACGKGTQCENIVKEFGVVHISTGDLLREQVVKQTALGKEAKKCMDNGQLVPDQLIINMVYTRLQKDDCKQKGWLLDGFPRTGAQAQQMKKLGIIANCFILITVPDEILVERCCGRRSDPVTGSIYHLKFNPPPQDEEILARLVHRSDDNEESMGKRIDTYHHNMESVVNSYSKLCQPFNGNQDKNKLSQQIANFIRNGEQPQVEENSLHKILITGPPASGKGTQSQLLIEKFNLVHISLGQLLRKLAEDGSELGQNLKQTMDKGELVADDIILDILKKRILQQDCVTQGWILDGFPRTKVQADSMKSLGIVPNKIIVVHAEDKVILSRAQFRLIDPQTGIVYRSNDLPADKELVARLVQRKDDSKEAFQKQLKNYHHHQEEIQEFYKKILSSRHGGHHKVYIKVNGNQKIEEINQKIQDFINL